MGDKEFYLNRVINTIKSEIGYLSESLKEELMTGSFLSEDDRKAMKAGIDCLKVVEKTLAEAINKIKDEMFYIVAFKINVGYYVTKRGYKSYP